MCFESVRYIIRKTFFLNSDKTKKNMHAYDTSIYPRVVSYLLFLQDLINNDFIFGQCICTCYSYITIP